MSACPCPKHPIGCYGHPHSCGCAEADKLADAKELLTASGYRILGPDEIDLVTVGKCAAITDYHTRRAKTIDGQRTGYAVAAAIRSLGVAS